MWYGQCGINPLTNKCMNCLYNGPAKPVDDPGSREILALLCPELLMSNSKVCCDHDQLVSLQSGIQSAQQMMSRCPGCWKNFRELYCHMACSPNNSMFIDPTKLSADNKSIIAIDYYVDEAFRAGLYNSCKNVVFPSSHQKIMNFMCGTSVENCTPLKFLDFMGNPELNGVAPFLVNYPVIAKPCIKPMNATITLCNESVHDPFTNSTRTACDCQDCVESCKHPFPIKYLAAKVIFSLQPGSELNQRTCYKNLFSKDCVLTGTILRLGILQKVYECYDRREEAIYVFVLCICNLYHLCTVCVSVC
jgi:Niemann-Pick C1 protein